MASLEHVFCQGRCLDVSILQCMSLFTHTLLQTSSCLANVRTWAFHIGDGIDNSGLCSVIVCCTNMHAVLC